MTDLSKLYNNATSRRYIHYGAVVYMQIGESEGEHIVCSSGFIVKNLFVIDFKKKDPINFMCALFVVVPPGENEIQQ